MSEQKHNPHAEAKLAEAEQHRSHFHKRVVACSEQLRDMRIRAEKAEAKLAEAEKGLEDHRRICNQHMRNIKTWMPEGFQSHCTDAMMIMADKRDEAQAACAKCRALSVLGKS